MELAIIAVALGGMYVISNQKKETEREPFVSTRELELDANVDKEARNTNDKYFNKQEKDTVANNRVYSLTGEYVDSDSFQHINMVPFYRAKGGMAKSDLSESVIDNMIGGGSQHIKKVEQAPLFKPEDSMQWAYGAPNQSDFYQSRVNQSVMKTNLKPFESEQVGPGLNKGYNSAGSGGFNSGMESRDAWLPKTVDELRVATKPKTAFELTDREGPAASQIKNLGSIGRVEKQRPDTYFENGPERWFTTTGAALGNSQRPAQEMGILRRNDVLTDYAGPASSNLKVGTAPEHYETSKRLPVMQGDVNHSSAVGRGPLNDAALKSHTNYNNHRSTVKQPTVLGGVGGAIGAVMAPFLDILKPNRKEETVSNLRIYGDLGSTVPKSYVLNSNDPVKTTMKETTIHSQSFNVNNQREGGYLNNPIVFDQTQRETTNVEHFGTSGVKYGNMSYEAAYKQHNNENKTHASRPNPGGTQMFNTNLNVNVAKQDVQNFYVNAPAASVPLAPSKEHYGRLNSSHMPTNLSQRMDGDLLSAFKANPYTHSLSSVA